MDQSSQPLVSVRKAQLESWKPPNVYRNTIALAHAAGYGRQPDGKSKRETTPHLKNAETKRSLRREGISEECTPKSSEERVRAGVVLADELDEPGKGLLAK